MMTPKEYSIKELADASGVDPRTIRFYIQQKLLRGPESRGRHARYSDYHLKRLQTVRTLREIYGLSLMEIRKQLIKAGDEDIAIAAFRQDVGGEYREVETPSLASPRMASHSRRSRMKRDKVNDDVTHYSIASPQEDLFNDKYVAEESDSSDLPSFMRPPSSSPPPSPLSSSSAPLDTLVESLGESLPHRRKTSRPKGESWRHIEITPEIKLQVKEVFSDEEMARFGEAAELIRRILLGTENE